MSEFTYGDRVLYAYGKHTDHTVKATVDAVHASGVEIHTDQNINGLDRWVVPEYTLTKTGYVSLESLLTPED